MPLVPFSVTLRVLNEFLLPLSTLETVRVHESFRDQHPSAVIALAAQAQLFRSRDES
jgi:hypothetical protein